MNKVYKTLDLYAAWLVEVHTHNSYTGIKNIIGLKVEHNSEDLFYSILDDCFFRILPKNDPSKNIWQNLQKRLFVEIYEYLPPYLKTFGMETYERLKMPYLTKEDLINNKDKLTFGYFSDFDYENLKTSTLVDYECIETIDEYIIDTRDDYEEKLHRLIDYDNRVEISTRRLKKD